MANISEGEIGTENDYVKKVKEFAKQDNAGVVVLCAKIEEDLASIDDNLCNKLFVSTFGTTTSLCNSFAQLAKKKLVLGLLKKAQKHHRLRAKFTDFIKTYSVQFY